MNGLDIAGTASTSRRALSRFSRLAMVMSAMAAACAGQPPTFSSSDVGGQSSGAPSPKVYTKSGASFSDQLEYPSSWSAGEEGPVTRFSPPAGAGGGTVSVVVVDQRTTPPPPVFYTYRTIRTVRGGDQPVLVQIREPAPADESGFAEIKHGDFAIAFASTIDRSYDPVFDRMLETFRFIPR